MDRRKPVRTHYDNLKVSRDAPDFIIRAAYKSLSQKHHPDKNPGNEQAAKVMAIINEAYNVLSDPVRREAHDKWIAKMEATAPSENETPKPAGKPQGARQYAGERQRPEPQPSRSIVVDGLLKVFRAVAITGALVTIAVFAHHYVEQSSTRAYSQSSTVNQPQRQPEPHSDASDRYERPNAAPNGKSWPSQAAYLSGYSIQANDGLSSVTVDNGQNDSDVFVKLVQLEAYSNRPVRHIYIPARSRFTLSSVSPGQYDIRYRDLNTGSLSRSEAFKVTQFPTETGTQYSDITLTLYKVSGGNFDTYPLTESEF